MSYWDAIEEIEQVPVLIGEMRLGSMIPACRYALLPASFLVSSMLPPTDGKQTLFCNHLTTDQFIDNWSEEAELKWFEVGKVRFRGLVYNLDCTPSYRANWSTFTIRGVVQPGVDACLGDRRFVGSNPTTPTSG